MNIHLHASLAVLAAAACIVSAPPSFAHGSDAAPVTSGATTNPATLVQLEAVRSATARFLDEQVAIDEVFELEKPELLVYADGPGAIHEHARISGFPATRVAEISGVIDPSTAA